MTEKSTTPYRDLFQAYAEETGVYLPRRKRQDIQMEIISLLEDALEDKCAHKGTQPDEAAALELLKEFGAPIAFAANYQTRNALIGPNIYRYFIWFLQLVLGVYLLQFLISLGLSAGQTEQHIREILGSFIPNVMQAFGTLVITFAILERTVPEKWLRKPFEEMTSDWDPADLKREHHRQPVKPGEIIFESLILIGLIILLAAFPQWVGIANNSNGVWTFIPILAETAKVYFPWMLALWLLQLVLNMVLLRRQYWDTPLRWAHTALNVFGIGLLVSFLYGPPLIGPNPAYFAMHNTSPNMPMLDTGFPVSHFVFSNDVFTTIIIILVLVNGFSLVMDVLKTIRDSRSARLSMSLKKD